jgi:AbrB family looped-hinge helix DNA binding protein
MDIVTVDKLGRVVLPKSVRKAMRLVPGSRMMAVPLGDRLVLERMDAAAIARQMYEDLKGVDIDRIVKEVKEEVDGVARREITDILAGRKPVRRRRPTTAARDADA